MKLHRDLGVTQKTAWFMLHRLREAWSFEPGEPFTGSVEVDETYFGGKRRNMHARKRDEFDGRGPSGKTAVVGMKHRESKQVTAKVVERTDAETLCGFVNARITDGTMVYTDDASAYNRLENHESVRHSVGEYLRGQGAHEWRGVVLVDAEAGTRGDVPQAEPEAPSTLHQRVLLSHRHA